VKRWFGRGRDDDRPPPPGSARPEVEDVAGLRTALAAVIRTVKASSDRLPTGAVVEIRDIGDRLAGLLDHEDRAGGADTYELATLAAVIRDYLPTSVDAYLALPAGFLQTHRNAEGQTPAEELHTQLLVMEKGVTELAQAIYSGDAQRLSVQGRFLDARFASSDLDL
jgi:hypothetical protein